MSGNPEKIDSKGPLYWDRSGSGFHRFLKKLKNQFERRKAKKDPESAPTYNKHKGWEL